MSRETRKVYHVLRCTQNGILKIGNYLGQKQGVSRKAAKRARKDSSRAQEGLERGSDGISW
jgi:hypothetical protein